MTAVRYISYTEQIIKAPWSNFQHDGVAALKLSERSPFPPGLSAKDLPGGRTQVLNVLQIQPIHHHPGESDEDCAPESISDTKNWLNWYGDLDNPNDREEDCESDDAFDIEPEIGIKDSECPEHWVVSAAPNVPGLIRPTERSMNQAGEGLMTVSAWKQGGIRETRKSRTDWVNMFSPGSTCCLIENFTYRNVMAE